MNFQMCLLMTEPKNKDFSLYMYCTYICMYTSMYSYVNTVKTCLANTAAKSAGGLKQQEIVHSRGMQRLRSSDTRHSTAQN